MQVCYGHRNMHALLCVNILKRDIWTSLIFVWKNEPGDIGSGKINSKH